MNDEYDNDAMLTREYQRASRAAAQAEEHDAMLTKLLQQADSIIASARESRQREYIRLDARTMVLATIDELNQYLLGNVTLEAATDAASELTHKLNANW